MPASMLTEFSEPGNEFYCPFCVKRGDQYDFVLALRRCNDRCGKLNANELAMKAANEARLLRLYNATLPPVTGMNLRQASIDQPTVHLMEDNRLRIRDKFMPVSVGADGNCLFRAVSLSLFGSENEHEQLRLRVFIEVARHRDFYDSSSSAFHASFKADGR